MRELHPVDKSAFIVRAETSLPGAPAIDVPEIQRTPVYQDATEGNMNRSENHK